MGHRRTTVPRAIAADELTGAMVGIGMLFAAEATAEPAIEDTLIAASKVGMDGDLRVLSVLTTSNATGKILALPVALSWCRQKRCAAGQWMLRARHISRVATGFVVGA